MTINARRLRHKITIQSKTDTQTYGEVQTTWGTFAIAYADIQPTTGREYFAARQIVDEALFKITIRYVSGVTTKMRILYDGDYYDIRDVGNVGTGYKYLEMICRIAQ